MIFEGNVEELAYYSFEDCKNIKKIVLSNDKAAPKFIKIPAHYYEYAKDPLKQDEFYQVYIDRACHYSNMEFHVKNEIVANELKANLEAYGAENTVIYVGGELFG